MAHPFEHAWSTARRFGGHPSDYEKVHAWFAQSKAFVADLRHRALRYHAEGISLAELIFGASLVNADGKIVSARYIGEHHVREGLGRIPSFQDWIDDPPIRPWMYGLRLELEKQL